MVEFRKDIQCLRGLSLLSVFLYHYNKNILPAGFIGVDVFFFISGYVNTLSYLSKIDKSITLFYINRLKRLFPVSHLSLFASIYLVKKMSILYQNKQYSDIIWALFSLSNYRFIYLAVDYLSQSETLSIILHYWSLAVEDQFYLLFPFFISILYKHSIILVAVILISLSYSYYININHHYISYFSIFSRFWQLLFGVLSTKRINISYIGIFYTDILLVILIIFCATVKWELLFPTPLSIFPLTIVYILLSKNNISFLFKSKLLLELGNISYSFYLFHYLIIHYFKDKNNKYNSIVYVFFITIIISYIVNIYYENPIRKAKNTFFIILFFFISFSYIISSCIINSNYNIKYMNSKFKYQSISKYTNNNYKKYIHIKSENMIYSPDIIKKVWRNFQQTQCACPFKSSKLISIINKYSIVLLLTDSHGEQWFNTIIPYSSRLNYIIIHVWFWEDTIITKNFERLYKLFNLIPKVEYIIISHWLSEKSKTKTFEKNYISYLEIILMHCNQIYVIHDTPQFKKNPNLCLLSTTNYENCFSLVGVNVTFFRFPIYKNERIHYIDMIPYICLNSLKCYYIWNSIPIYLDDNHLTFQFTATLSNQLLSYIHFAKQTKRNSLNCKKSFKCGYSSDL